MLVHHSIVRHWQTEMRVLNKNLLMLKQQITADPVHDLRVSIKKIRSYFKLCLALSGEHAAKGLSSRTGELFSMLGNHRNIEISRKLLLTIRGKEDEHLHSILVYLQLLQEQVSEYCRKLISEFDSGELNELTEKMQAMTGKFDSEQLSNEVRSIIKSHVEDVKHQHKHFKERFHLVRKSLKNIYYWETMFGSEIVFTKSQLNLVDKILDHLGNIQDHQVTIRNLKNFRKTILTKTVPEYEVIKAIELKAKKKKDDLLDKADKLTHELLKKF